MLYPPKGAARAEPKVVQLFLLIFYFKVWKRILDFNLKTKNSLFETSKCFSVRMDGTGRNRTAIKSVFIFFHFIQVYLKVYKKITGQIFCGFYILVKLRDRVHKFKNTIVNCFLFKIILKLNLKI